MKCKECKIWKFKLLEKLLDTNRAWHRMQAFGKHSGEYKGNLLFCSIVCRQKYFLKNNYSLN